MVSFLQTAKGGIQPINGKAGSIIEDAAKAEKGKPGHDVIINVVNQITTATQISLPRNACNPQAALQRAQQQLQQRIQQIIEQHIQQEVRQEVENSTAIKDLQKQLETIQKSEQSESTTQQTEIIEKEIQNQVNSAILGAIGRTATQLPEAAKVANSTAAGIKTVASVAESLSTFVPSQGINMGAYGAQKTVQTVSQACSI